MYFDAQTLGRLLQVVHAPKTFGLRRLVLMDTLVGVWSSVHAINAACELVDARRHPDHLDTDVGAPIYIVAAPRSGTTFLHRLMSLDTQFTTFKLYETIFPTIAASEVIEHATREGGLLARLAGRIKRTIDERSFGGWEGLHDTGLDKDEEDEALWALMMATPAILLLLPFPERFAALRFVDALPEDKKAKLAASYRACLQRKLFRHPGRTLLMKNVLLPGRFDIVTRAAPNARFVHIVRHPYEALASMLSLFTMPWSVLAPEVHGDSDASRSLADLMIDYYRFLYETERATPPNKHKSFVVIKYTDLVKDPLGRLREVYARLGLDWSKHVEDGFAMELDEQSEFRSSHSYSLAQYGLTEAYVDERLGDVMDYYGFERRTAKRVVMPATTV